MHTLFLGSSSVSRQQLLRDARIPFQIIEQTADESVCDWGLPLQQLVETIALYKMDHVKLPAAQDGDYCYVLTADTLSQDAHGAIHGKPVSREDAVIKLKQAREGMYTGTAFVLEKKIMKQGAWHTHQRILKFVGARYVFYVPDEWIDRYLDSSLGLKASGAIAIEGYGSLFLQSVQGSYTTIVGLPLYEVRQALTDLSFFKQL